MKRNIFLVCIVVLMSISLFVSSCSEDKVELDRYHESLTFPVEDTVLTSGIHEFSLPVHELKNPSVKVNDWNIGAIDVWDPKLPGNRDQKWWVYNPNITYDWITIDKRDGELYLEVKPNDTDEERRVRIHVWRSEDNDYAGLGEVIISQLPAKKEEDSRFEVQVRYKGELYSSMAMLDENEELVYESMEFSALMKTLASRDDLDMVVTESGVLNIFDGNDAEALEALNDIKTCVAPGTPFSLIEPKVYSRAKTGFEEMSVSALGYCALFDDNTFSDTHVSKNLMNFDDIYDITDLKKYSLNDKVTSVAVGYNGTDDGICAVLTVWEDTFFNFEDYDRTKHRVSFISTYSDKRVSWKNLKSLPCINSGNSWNDRISSFSFHFGYYNNYLKDY